MIIKNILDLTKQVNCAQSEDNDKKSEQYKQIREDLPFFSKEDIKKHKDS